MMTVVAMQAIGDSCRRPGALSWPGGSH